jgi:AcrR family transcriptional regulator
MQDMSTTIAIAPRSPGRPRSTRADEAIVDAVLDMLAEGSSMEALSIEAVAARAGVGKATIYRRWSGKEALIADAIRTLKGPTPQPAGKSVREDLVMLLSFVARPADKRALQIMPCMVPEIHRSPEQRRIYQELTEPRRELMREVLRRGVQTGELRDDFDIEVAIAMLAGPVLMQKLMAWNPKIDEKTLPEKVVDGVLRGLAAD